MLNKNNEYDPCILDPRVLWADEEHGLHERRPPYIFVRPVEAYRALLQVIRDDRTGWYRQELHNRHIFVSEDMLRHVKRVESELPRLKHRKGHGKSEPQQKETKWSKQRKGIKIPDSYYYNTTVFHAASVQSRKRPHPSSSMTTKSAKSCHERSMESMNSETAMTSEPMNMKTDEDLLFGKCGAVGAETVKEMRYDLIQNVKTDDDLTYGAGFQAMRLDSQSPPNQECPERSMGSMNSETAMTSESMNMKTDEDLLFGGSGAVGVETAKEMWCELIQNVKTDDDLIHGAGFQAMRLDSQEWQWPANQEWHIPPEQEWQFPPTNDQLIETDFSLL
jgi:hypothetical protein